MTTQPKMTKLETTKTDAKHLLSEAKASTVNQDAPRAAYAYEALDRMAHAAVAKATSGLSPSVLGEAWMD